MLTAFLIVLAIAILAFFISQGAIEYKRKTLRDENTSDNEMVYRKGCDMYTEVLTEYQNCALLNQEHTIGSEGDQYQYALRLLGYDIQRPYLWPRSFFMKIPVMQVWEADMQDDDDTKWRIIAQNHIIEQIPFWTEGDYEKIIALPYFNFAALPSFTREKYVSILKDAQYKFANPPRGTRPNKFACVSTWDMVAKKYDMPTSRDVEGTSHKWYYSINGTIDINEFIVAYLSNKLGYHFGSSFGHQFPIMKPRPTEEDIQQARDCDGWVTQLDRSYEKDKKLYAKFPDMDKSSKKHKKK